MHVCRFLGGSGRCAAGAREHPTPKCTGTAAVECLQLHPCRMISICISDLPNHNCVPGGGQRRRRLSAAGQRAGSWVSTRRGARRQPQFACNPAQSTGGAVRRGRGQAARSCAQPSASAALGLFSSFRHGFADSRRGGGMGAGAQGGRARERPRFPAQRHAREGPGVKRRSWRRCRATGGRTMHAATLGPPPTAPPCAGACAPAGRRQERARQDGAASQPVGSAHRQGGGD